MTAKPFCDGPFSTLKGTSWIVGKDHHGEPCHVLDQRGWGYLTGKGQSALGLDSATASAMQADTQQWVVDALNAAWSLRAVQPAQVPETCGKCMGSGYGGHPDSGQLCADCNGSGGVEPQPDQTVEIDLRAAMMEELEKAASESPWVPEEYYMNEVISDCCAFLRSDRSQPDPRDEVIKGLVDALCEAMIVPEAWYISGFPNISVDAIDQTKRAVPLARAALAAAKAVQK